MGPDDAPPPRLDPDAQIPRERWAQLDDYFGDRLPLAERVEMDRWVAEREDRQRLIGELRDLWRRAEHAAPELGSVDIRSVLNTLAAKREAIEVAARTVERPPVVALDEHRKSVRAARRMPGARTRRRWIGTGAAVAAAALILSVALPLTSRRTSESVNTAPLAPRVITTKRAQQATLDLADGSRVVLAAGSTLRIPADFDAPSTNGTTRRELYLEGKAYFEVAHDSTRPFIVRTPTAVTEDLGTEFVIRAYPESHETQVAVVSGLVELRAPSTSAHADAALRLEPGDVARMDSAGATSVEHEATLASFVSWTNGVLAFDGVPLREALAELSRWYDVEFELSRGRALDTLRITGEFRDEPVSVAMQRLALMLDVRATRVGGAIHLSPARGAGAGR